MLRSLARQGFITSLAKGIRERSTAFDSETFRSLALPTPRIQVQNAIADYLDRETARIDALIAAKRQMGELLEEQRQAWLSAQVQSSASAESFTKLKFVARIQGGVTLGKSYTDQDARSWPYLRVANVQAYRVDLTEIATIDLPVAVAARHRLRTGDLLLAEGNGNPDNLARAVVWNGEVQDCLHQNHVFALRPTNDIRPRYLEAVLATDRSRRHFREGASQVGMRPLAKRRFWIFAFPLLPYSCKMISLRDSHCMTGS